MEKTNAAWELGRIGDDEITEPDFDRLIVRVMDELRGAVARNGRATHNVRYALSRHAGRTVDPVGHWLASVTEQQALDHLAWLGAMAAGYGQACWRAECGWGVARALSGRGRAGWARAISVLREHLPAQMKWQLALNVHAVQGVDGPVPGLRANTATKIRVVCCQWSAQGYLSGTRYHVDLRRPGRAAGAWKISRRAHQGLTALVQQVTEEYDPSPSGWQVTFESNTCRSTSTNWRDGREEFTSTQFVLGPGRVVDVAPLTSDTAHMAQREPVAFVPARSAFEGTPIHKLFASLKALEHMESLLGAGPEK